MPDIPAAPVLNLYTAAGVRELDRQAIEVEGVPGLELMERAGRTAWNHLIDAWPGAGDIAVVCGAGNNAGDGYVLARLALEQGWRVSLLALADPGDLRGDARAAAEKYLAARGRVSPFAGAAFAGAGVIVDALLGTGLDREVTGPYRAAIEAMNDAKTPVLSIDIPSGLEADTGRVLGAAVRAAVTVTFIGRKQGLYTGDAADYRGNTGFADLDVPSAVYQRVRPSAHLVDPGSYLHLLSRRARTAHKGHYGHVLVVGGDYGYAGAARMAAEAAARCGAGLVSIATRPEHAVTIPTGRPELMAAGIQGADGLSPLLERASVIALGPGLAQSGWSRSLFGRILETRLPLVVDADGLNLLAQDPVRRDNWVLTPHPGEAARLLDTSVAEIQGNRFAAAAALQEKYGGSILLKGSGTLVMDDTGNTAVCAGGNPGMASGGMGDVLTGLVAGLIAQGLAAGDAAGLAACVHGAAADRLAAEYGERGLLATDLLPVIRRLLNPA